MNKQELNNAFESFNPTEEQKQRMLANIMTQKSCMTQKVSGHIWKKIYIPACSLAAAALMFAVISGALVPKDITDNSYVVQNNENDTVVVSEYKEKDTSFAYSDTTTQTTAEDVEKVNEISKNHSKPAKKTSDKVSATSKPEIIPGEVATFAMNINTLSHTPKARAVQEEAAVAEEIYSEETHMPAYGGDSSAVSEASAVTYTYEDFCNHIGFDVKAKLSLGEDMMDITDIERTMHSAEVPEEWDLVYQGNDDRILTINIARDVGQNMQYFESGDLVKTDVNGTAAVVMSDGVSYTAYISCDNMAYVIATNVSEDELATVLRGVAD